MATLYELKSEYLQLLQMMLDGEEEEIVADTLEAVQGEIEEKLESYKIIDAKLQTEEEMFMEEIERLQDRVQSLQKSRNRLKEKMVDMVSVLPDQTAKSRHFTFKMVKNGGKAPLIYTEGMEVPESFMKVVKTPDTELIREALKTYELDFVKLGERGSHLSIK